MTSTDGPVNPTIIVGPRVLYYSIMRPSPPRIIALNTTFSAPFFSDVLPTIPYVMQLVSLQGLLI